MIKQEKVYKYCVKCRATLKQYNNYKACTSCGKHYYFNPKACVSAILINDMEEILLTKRIRAPFKNWWDLPGGFVDEKETLEGAITRELKEEIGSYIDNLEYVGSFEIDYPFQNEIVPAVTANFIGKIVGDINIKIGDDVSDYKFVPIKEIKINTIAFKKQQEFLKKFIKKTYNINL